MCNLSYATTQICSCKRQLQNPEFLIVIDEGIIYEGQKFQEHIKGTIILFEFIWAFLKVFHIQKKLL